MYRANMYYCICLPVRSIEREKHWRQFPPYETRRRVSDQHLLIGAAISRIYFRALSMIIAIISMVICIMNHGGKVGWRGACARGGIFQAAKIPNSKFQIPNSKLCCYARLYKMHSVEQRKKVNFSLILQITTSMSWRRRSIFVVWNTSTA